MSDSSFRPHENSLIAADNPIVRLYQLFSLPGAIRKDGPWYLGVEGLALTTLGSGQAIELIALLRNKAYFALDSCRLTMNTETLVDFSTGSVVDWFDWELLEELNQLGLLDSQYYEIFVDLREPLEHLRDDGYWGSGGDPVSDCLKILHDLHDAAANNGSQLTLELLFEKTPLVQEFLLNEAIETQQDLSGLVWYDLDHMHQAFDSFQAFLDHFSQAAKRPTCLFFFQPVDTFDGDYLKVISLERGEDDLSGVRERLSNFTPEIVTQYSDIRALHSHELRPDLGERYSLSPALLLRQEGQFASYPDHPLFAEGPMRSLVVYAILAWLAEFVGEENGLKSFRFSSDSGWSRKIVAEFKLTDVLCDADSIFKNDDWPTILTFLAYEIQRCVGSRSLRRLWSRATELTVVSEEKIEAANLLSILERIRHEFRRLEQQPSITAGLLPDVELQIFLERKPAGSELMFKLHSKRQLGFFYQDVGSTPLGVDDSAHRFEDLSELARHHLERALEREDSAQSSAPPGLQRLESLGGEMWAKLIPESLKRKYARLRRQKDLTALIVSNDPSFPWELVKPYEKRGSEVDEDGFTDLWWALQFVLARWLAGHRPPADKIELKRTCCVVTSSGLSSALEEERFFKQLEVPVDLPGTKGELFEFLKTRDYGILHFACHGDFSDVRPGRSMVEMPDGTSLEPTEFFHKPGIEEKFSENGPLVFLNSCHSGRLGTGLTGIEGWAKRFIDMQCGAFIGCGWEVADPMAASFATAFYRRFIGGATLGRAVRESRKRTMKQDRGNSTWLAYFLYGDPNCRLITSSSKASE